MPEETGQMIIFVAGVLLVLGGLLGLAPILRSRRAKEGEETIRSREKRLVRRTTVQAAADAPDPRLEEPSDEAFESLLIDVRAEDPLADPEIAPSLSSSLSAYDDADGDPALVEELFAELFTIRAALASLTTEVKSLRGSLDDRRAEKSEQTAA